MIDFVTTQDQIARRQHLNDTNRFNDRDGALLANINGERLSFLDRRGLFEVDHNAIIRHRETRRNDLPVYLHLNATGSRPAGEGERHAA